MSSGVPAVEYTCDYCLTSLVIYPNCLGKQTPHEHFENCGWLKPFEHVTVCPACQREQNAKS